MTLTVADIERWNSDAVRDVFHAATARAQSTQTASRELGALAVFDNWEGEASTAARHAIAQTRQDLDAHGNEALVVGRAARQAADDIDTVQAQLRDLKNRAADAGLEVDPVSNRIVPMPHSTHGRREMQQKIPPLQAQLDRIVAKANDVDRTLATAINMADGDQPIPPQPHDNRPEIQDALSRPLPQDPKQFSELWDKLTDEEKDYLYNQDHSVGNHPGMPWGYTDAQGVYHRGKDYYNRMHLSELQSSAQSEVDALRGAHPAWAAGRVPNPKGDARTYRQWAAWKKQWDAANHTLTGYHKVSDALQSNDGIPRMLGLVDDQGHAAVAIGNPDLAGHNAILVPGTGQDLTKFDAASGKSMDMFNATLAADKNLTARDVAVTTWMGYDRPMDLIEAASPDPAIHDGARLDQFLDGMHASHQGAPAVDTVIGHSYGSTLVGGAATGGNHLAAENVIAVGSPGMLADNTSQLSLDSGAKVFAATAEHDPIQFASGLTLGANPFEQAYGATRLVSSPGPATFGIFPSIEAHSSYWDEGNPALADMGAIIAGVSPPHVYPDYRTISGR